MKQLERLFRVLSLTTSPVGPVLDPLAPWERSLRKYDRLLRAEDITKKIGVAPIRLSPEQAAAYKVAPMSVTISTSTGHTIWLHCQPSTVRSTVAALNSSVDALEKDWEKVAEDGEKVRGDFERAASHA